MMRRSQTWAAPDCLYEEPKLQPMLLNYTTGSMTRLLYTPHRGADLRTPSTTGFISRSTSSTSSPSLQGFYLSKNNNTKGVGNHNTTKGVGNHNHHLQQTRLLSCSTSNIMSLREAPGRAGAPVSRSHSFGGVSIGSNCSGSSAPTVLGDTVKRSPRVYAKPQLGSKAFKKSPKVPKVPRPSRALMVFDSVKKGIGEFIQATHEDIAQLMASESGTSTAQQIKAAERYLKRLEFHLAKIDELHDCYVLNQQLREGAKNMARAYSATTSQSRKDSLANVKYGYKECSQTMCAIEAQLENMLGTFSCRLKGIAGFARLVPGDVFEVVIKHGAQKWKTKGRIEKNNTQRWDTPDFTFKSLVGETLSIKASEVRAFKSVLLGQKNCEICHPSTHDSTSQGLFSANPQLMTVSVNVHGSLKLSFIITWNPLDGMDESVTFFEPPSRAQGRRPMSYIGTNSSPFGSNSDLMSVSDKRFTSPMQSLKQRDDSGIYGSATSLPSHMTPDSLRHAHSLSGSPIMHGRDPSLTPDLHTGRLRPHSVIASDVRSVRSQPSHPTSSARDFNSSRPHSTYISSQSTQQPDGGAASTSSSSSSSIYLSQTALSTSSVPHIPEVTQAMVPGVMIHGEMVPYDGSLTVEEALGSLMTTLEDFLGHYTELQKLEEVVPVIEALIRKPSATSSRSSSMSVSIDCAIEEAFEFLNTEEALEDLEEEDEEEKKEKEPDRKDKSLSTIEEIMMSPESTAKTADSGIESLAKRLQEDTQLGSSMGSSPVPPSSGNEQVDQALVFHLTYCDKLLENLGNYGPLKCREFYALDRLQKQAIILEILVTLAKAGPEIDLHAVLMEESVDKLVRELWVLCVDQTPLYVHPEKIVSVLESKYGPKIAEHYDIKPTRVFHQLMARLLDVPAYLPEIGRTSIITLHQFMLYFKDGEGLNKMEGIAEELRLMDRLNSGTADTVIKAILTLREELPPPTCLKMLSKLLASGSKETQQSAASYLRIINREKSKRDKAMVILVEGLEDHIAEVRAGCCAALSILEAEESIDQLVHVSQSDSLSTVRRKAKEALYSLGDAGRKAVEEAQLGSQGFQGLQMRKL
ncbi:rho family-interacting cell polarization regulator 2-like isoform X2 [Physella acuta]|uniref:rho family-interacting cell polarization regulator 2-like isoform X2 n=1 Tax=Physella acuta TaxID=109671 RepID=UPI0027DB739A|nr:rho family-interacting cell polarization regulator 2-like isoform X2 [Physella acuta]